jgi:RNA polymerase sigma-70 factor, ECF subfamily
MARPTPDALAREADRLLVDAVMGGNTEAFRELVEREGATVLTVCRRILADPTEAEDAAQDAFLAAYEKLGSYRGDGPLGGWLMRIAIREAQHRGRRRRAISPLEPEGEAAAANISGEASPDPVAIVEADELERWLHAALDGLPDHYRDAVRLHYLEELSYDEIAAVTGRQAATVRAHARRGLLRLREDLVAEPGS